MHAENASVDYGAQCEIIKDLAAPPPDVGARVLALTLVIEAVYLRDLTRFVVAADQGNALWVADFECEEEEERFDAVESAVYKVPCLVERVTFI
jgi:hypothetical protein